MSLSCTPRVLGAAVLALLLVADPAGADEVRRVVVAHTGSLSGRALPVRAGADAAPAGGLEALAREVRRARAEAEARGAGFVYVDTGDFWQGTPEGTLTGGRLVTAWFEAVGLDALTVGDHDFDLGADHMAPMLSERAFPTLVANLYAVETQSAPGWARASVVLERGGLKVALIGVLAEETKRLVSPKAMAGLLLRSGFEAVREEVARVRADGAEVILVLSHQGPEADRELARGVEGIDAILACYGGPAEVIREGGALIHAVPPDGIALGLVEVTRGERPRAEARTVPALPEAGPLCADIHALIRREAGEVLDRTSVPLGEVATFLDPGHGTFRSSALGSWTADLMRAEAGADVALTNKAGLRAGLAPGVATARDLFAVSPFDNELVTLTLTGRELRAALLYALTEPRFALEVSGLTVRYDLERPEDERLIQVLVGAEPLDDGHDYRVVTNSFLAKGGHGHQALAGRRDRVRTETKVLDLQVEDLKRRGRLALEDDGRVAPAASTMPRSGG